MEITNSGGVDNANDAGMMSIKYNLIIFILLDIADTITTSCFHLELKVFTQRKRYLCSWFLDMFIILRNRAHKSINQFWRIEDHKSLFQGPY